MTAAGPSRKSAFFGLFVGLALVLGGAALRAATTERVVADPGTWIALYGFDPVTYFTESEPALGRPEVEYRFAGVTWRFRNEGNRAAFAADPDVYMPRFGGYDPLGVARGVASPGYPQLWLRRENAVYLFHKAETRAAFAADPQGSLQAAEGRWPAVMQGLVP